MTEFELYAVLRTQLKLTTEEAREEVAALVRAIDEAEQGEGGEEEQTL